MQRRGFLGLFAGLGAAVVSGGAAGIKDTSPSGVSPAVDLYANAALEFWEANRQTNTLPPAMNLPWACAPVSYYIRDVPGATAPLALEDLAEYLRHNGPGDLVMDVLCRMDEISKEPIPACLPLVENTRKLADQYQLRPCRVSSPKCYCDVGELNGYRLGVMLSCVNLLRQHIAKGVHDFAEIMCCTDNEIVGGREVPYFVVSHDSLIFECWAHVLCFIAKKT